mmetsp:Transcript_21481/g.69343  ORF Transcript_21481/g.69343 Transcript_21481/m.69343 type:complete len:317 (-) Transcript_21481:266-1216(-)
MAAPTKLRKILSGFEYFPPQPATVQVKCQELECDTMISAASGLELTYYTLKPKEAPTLGCVVFMHGILEHSYRYLHAFQLLASQGWAVAALDIRGHGLSDGTKGYLPDMYEAVADELQFLKLLQARKLAATGGYHLWGQSFGGLLAVLVALDAPQGSIASCVLTSPAMANELDCALNFVKVIKLGELIACLNPTLKMVDVVAPSGMSRSVAEQERYTNDPLNSPGPIMIKTGVEIGHAQEDAFRRASEFSLPLWIGFGTEDKVNHAPGAQDFLSKVATPEHAKEFQWYDGLFHTLAFEEEREQVFADVLAFLAKHK